MLTKGSRRSQSQTSAAIKTMQTTPIRQTTQCFRRRDTCRAYQHAAPAWRLFAGKVLTFRNRSFFFQRPPRGGPAAIHAVAYRAAR